MKLEVGKKYRTSDNKIVTITKHNPDYQFCFEGDFEYCGRTRSEWWRGDGSFAYLIIPTHPFDIVEEVIEAVE